MARMRFDSYDDPSNTGTNYNEGHFGGYANTTEGGVVKSTNIDDYTKMYRDRGEAAMNRSAYQADFSGADANMARAAQARAQQQQAAAALGQAAAGNAPSGAAIRGGMVGEQSLLAGLSQSAGARSSMAQVAAMRAATQGMQASQLAGQDQALGARANELAQARGGYMQGASAMRSGDYAAQGVYQQQAEARAQAEMAQRELNQQAQLAEEQRAWDVTKGEQDRALRQEQVYAQQYATDSARDNARKDGWLSMFGAGVGAVGSGFGAAMKSDARAKTGVLPLMDSPDGRPLRMSPDGHAYYGDLPRARLEDLTGSASLSGGGTPARSQASAAEPKTSAKKRRPSLDELAAWADRETASTRAKTDAVSRQAPAVSARRDMGDALAAGLAPYEYSYKPEYARAEGQTPTERNVGPMAQDMASNPVTASAVKRGPDGMLYIDGAKAQKLSLAAVGYLAAKQKQQETELERLRKERR